MVLVCTGTLLFGGLTVSPCVVAQSRTLSACSLTSGLSPSSVLACPRSTSLPRSSRRCLPGVRRIRPRSPSARCCCRQHHRSAPCRSFRSTSRCERWRLTRFSSTSRCVLDRRSSCGRLELIRAPRTFQPPHVWRLVHHQASAVLPEPRASSIDYGKGRIRPASPSSGLKAANAAYAASSCLLVVTLVVHIREDASDRDVLGQSPLR
jgi:hypothetical protein